MRFLLLLFAAIAQGQTLQPQFLDVRNFNFTPLNAPTLTGGVAATATIRCPAGVNGSNLYHSLYIYGGTGTAETVTITGGTCTSGASSGTITFTPANSHTGSFIKSATAGIQEAIYSAAGRSILIPPGTYPIYGTIAIGNGDATLNGFTVQSTYNGIRLLGSGATRDWTTASSTKLQWQGADGGTMLQYHGPVSHVELAYMALDGNNKAGHIIVSSYGDQGSLHDLLLGNSKAIAAPNTYWAYKCDYGCGSNVLQNVFVVQQQSGTSAIALGYAPGSAIGVSQNTLIHVNGSFPGDTSTSFGLALQACDNNQILMSDFLGTPLLVTAASNTTPIQITLNRPVLGLATGQKVTILGVAGNTAANNTAANPTWTITAIDTTHFTLDTSVGNGAYTSGGSVTGPGYALALISAAGTNEPFENTFLAGAFFYALISDDNGVHGTNHMYGITTGDGFLIPPGVLNHGLLNPDYYVNPDAGGAWSRFTGLLKFVDSDGILGYMKLYPETRCVAIGDGLEAYACDNDLTIVRNAATANLNIFSNTSGDAKVNLRTANGNAYGISSDQTNNYLKIFGPGGNALIVTPGGDRVMTGLPTSCVGKVAGTLWNNAGALSVCP